jgi:hypothetical protein
VAILSGLSSIVALIAFLDTERIDYFILSLARSDILMSVFMGIVASFFVAAYLHFIKKIIKRRKINVFISYAHSSIYDMYKVRRFLSTTSNIKVYDFDAIPVGQVIESEIERMIDDSTIVIILFDENYFQSNNCKVELRTLLSKEKTIIPILKTNDIVAKLPSEVKRLKYLIISDDDSWGVALKHSLHDHYRHIRERKK